jgi:thiol-disulfide isomerase/thioredoxin
MLMQFHVMAATFGDAEARQSIEAIAQSDAPDRVEGQAALLLVDWFRSNKDAAAQTQILEKAEALAKASPQSNAVTEILMAMTQIGAASDEIEDRAEKIATAMSSEAAQQAKAQSEAKAKLEQAQGQPLVIRGTTVDGKPFSTSDWKGKVVLIDFWATWCGPCIAELPRVKKAYADFHDKGLEILGVSNDMDGQKLKDYVTKNPDMPWPQLFDADAAAKGEWHPVTVAHGIDGIPTMFLIDKKGVCRTVTARENFEELIPKLLAEPD